jgi:hypothetical protein
MKNYDPKCRDLAELFLEGEPHLNTLDRQDDLAATIQQAIEDWFQTAKNNYEPPSPPGFEAGFSENH